MNDELQWFACLCLDSGIVDHKRCRRIYDSLEDPEDILGFGQRFLDEGLVEDIDVVQQLLDDACDRVDAEEKPPYDPFAPVEPAGGRGLKLATSASAPESVEVAPEPFAEVPSVEPGSAEAQVEDPAASSVEEPESAAETDPTQEAASVSGGGGADPAGQADRKPAESVVPADGLDPVLPDFDSILSMPERQLRAALIGLLKRCVETGASDLHLCAAARPFERKDRENHYLSETVLSAEAARRLNTALLNVQQIEYFDREKDFDFAIPFSTGERFRVNLMSHKDGMAGTYRMVPPKIRSLESLGFENAEVIKKLLSYHNGLILVTGPAGCGKTATLASLVHEMNQNREDHVITVEEPIEMVQVSNKCSITQRGVGPHTNTFHSALKGALRQDPDIIVIGEMRDLETIEMAISASETGHLVIGTMHTSDAATTLNRVLDVFPPAQQTQIRAMVAESLRGIICQRLLPAKDGGLVLACELLLRNTAVSSLIREGKTQGLDNVMETGKGLGMIQMDASILQLYHDGKITAEVAKENLKNDMLKMQIT